MGKQVKVVSSVLVALWLLVAAVTLGEYAMDKAYAQTVVGNVCAVTDPVSGHGFILGGM